MFKTASKEVAAGLAAERSQLWGHSVFNGALYVGTEAELRGAGVVDMHPAASSPTAPAEPSQGAAQESTWKPHTPECDPIHAQLREAHIRGPVRGRGAAGVREWQENLSRLRKLLPCGPAVLALLLSAPTAFAAPPAKPDARPRPKPALTYTVKVWPAKLTKGQHLLLSTVTGTTCTAWIAEDTDVLYIAARDACKAAMLGARTGGAK